MRASSGSAPNAADAAGRAGKPDTLATLAYRLLEEAIVTQRIAPGATVSEAQLSDLIDMSRMPTREAVRRLQRENLLEVLPKRGIVVRTIDPHTQLRLLAMRREVERLLAWLAARECGDAQRAKLLELAADFENAAASADTLCFVHTDKAFNDLCLAACSNEFVVDTIRLLQGPSRRFWFQCSSDAQVLAESACRHAALARAIASGDADMAAAASDHLIDFGERLALCALELDRASIAPR
jgi:DNA-binding GntR family transcriptional regulator